MKKLIYGVFALFCLVVFIPAAFAEDVAGAPGADTSWFKPTLRAGVAFDVADTHYTFVTKRLSLLGATSINLNRPTHARFYLATELPFAVTDRLAVTLGGSWAFSGSERELREVYNSGGPRRTWDSDGTSHWVSADLLVSYALIKNTAVVKDLSVVAGLRWNYETMSFDNPHNTSGVASIPADTGDFRMQTLAPLFGLTCTFAVPKTDIWGGDIKLGFLAGPIV
jgi:hypothetical protein